MKKQSVSYKRTPKTCPTDLLQTILRTGCTVKVILQTSWMNSETKNIWLHNFTKKSVMQTIWKWQKNDRILYLPHHYYIYAGRNSY